MHGVLSRRQMQHAWCGFVTPAGVSHVYGPVNHTDYSITSSPVIGTARGSWRSGLVDTQDGCLLLWRNQDSNPCSILTVGTLPKGVCQWAETLHQICTFVGRVGGKKILSSFAIYQICDDLN